MLETVVVCGLNVHVDVRRTHMNKQISIALVAFVALALLVLPAAAATNIISQGDVVFIGEQGLDVSRALGSVSQIAWWASGTDPAKDVPSDTMNIGDASSFYVAPADFVGQTGNWYQYPFVNGTQTVAFTVKEPSISAKIMDGSTGEDVTGKAIPVGHFGNFRLETNMYSIADRAQFQAADGPVVIKVKSRDGATFSSLYGANNAVHSLEGITPGGQIWYWVGGATMSTADGWNTAAVDDNENRYYKSGVYTAWGECNLNGMKDNYVAPDGSDYTGKTVTGLATVTIATDSVNIEASEDSVTRGNQFSVTVTGIPSQLYYLWVKGTGSMSGQPTDQPPMISLAQASVYQDQPGGPYTIGSYQYEGGAGKTLKEDVPNAPEDGVKYYAQVETSTSGTRTVGFTTSKDTKDKKYTIRVEKLSGNQYKSDEVDILVEEGEVTVVAEGTQSYYLGEEVKLVGTNSETSYTYLFITGPNLPTNGGQLVSPREPVINGQPATFTVADVQDDFTWDYKWQTANLEIDAGTYTIYALSAPNNRESLSDAQYGTVSVVIKKPFISAQASTGVVAKGDKLVIRGTAEGDPSAGVAIWILGKNKALYSTESVNDDMTFEFEVKGATTQTLYSGQYFVVIQHPMYNDQFDVYPDDSTDPQYVLGTYPQAGSEVFKLAGPGSLQGTDAAEALVTALNQAMIDDTYTKMQFLVEEPKITILPIGEQMVGSKFDISGTTNLMYDDDELLVEVTSSSFKPTDKSQSGEFSGVSGTVPVVKGTDGINKWSFPVDASTFKPDEYIVRVSGITNEVVETGIFNVVEFTGQPIVAPTPEITPIATPEVNVTPEMTPEVIPEETPEPIPTETPTPTQSPGFGALVALSGLVAVAFLVVRRS